MNIMKKTLTTLVVLSIFSTLNAQVYIGGTLGFKSQDIGDDNTVSFQIAPEIGYTLNDSWAIGFYMSYGQTNYASTIVNTGLGQINDVSTKLANDLKVFQFAPYARYTFAKTEMIDFFVDGSIAFENASGSGITVNTWLIGIQPGIAVNFNDRISFVTKLGNIGFQSSKADVEGAKTANSFEFGVSSLKNINFGLYYKF